MNLDQSIKQEKVDRDIERPDLKFCVGCQYGKTSDIEQNPCRSCLTDPRTKNLWVPKQIIKSRETPKFTRSKSPEQRPVRLKPLI